MTTRMTIAEFAKLNGVHVKRCERVDSNPHMETRADWRNFKVQIACGKRRMTLYFSQGSAWTQDPSIESILSCLASDAASVADSDFESWCADLGYETDSRKAERTYKLCERQSKKLANLLGEAFETLLYHTESL